MRRFFFCAALFALALPAPAQGRELHWELLSVQAHLDAGGQLQVEETQTMVFTGDWNGGERTFNIRPRQSVTVREMRRIDPQTGAVTPMQQGGLSLVDNWDWAQKNVLRWRSRDASAPPFDRTRITYVIVYTLDNILLREEERFVLDHDFAFPEREGPIERFQLKLTFDPAWKPLEKVEPTYAAGPLQPGRSFVLRIPLEYSGDSAPAAIDSGLSPTVTNLLFSLLIGPVVFFLYALFREKTLGRLDPVRPEVINRAWLQQHLLRTPPEVIGAMWDEDVGGSEVSAVLARMVAEGKMTSRVAGEDMHLTLQVPREQLQGYERELVDGLFVSGDSTSTDLVKSHYKDSGFNPASLIKSGVEKVAEERLPQGEKARVSGWIPGILFFGAVGVLAWGMVRGNDPFLPGFIIFIIGIFVSAIAAIAPSFWRKYKAWGVGAALLSLIPAAIAVAAGAFVIRLSAVNEVPPLSMWQQIGLAMMALFVFTAAVNSMRSRESRESIAFRKMLTAAREYFRRELEKPQPALDDSWYPYILAFGLANHVNRWFKQFPAAATFGHGHSTHTSSSSGSSSSTPSWTGGGGAFGGGGASAAWAAAATGMAAGVSPPRSSGGSSGGSSSGGSSGGGGGGGW
jgi:hypothetical protein